MSSISPSPTFSKCRTTDERHPPPTATSSSLSRAPPRACVDENVTLERSDSERSACTLGVAKMATVPTGSESICVSVRVRPLSVKEREDGNGWLVHGNEITQCDETGMPLQAKGSGYSLDNVFDEKWQNADVYAAVTGDLIKSVVEGFNATVFAYGQTSSGKTHTMRGTNEDPGIIPLAVSNIFNMIEATQGREFLLRVSYMELYNEQINDLLAIENRNLQIHESPDRGVRPFMHVSLFSLSPHDIAFP